MKTSEILIQAWTLLSQPGAFTQRAPARNATMEAVHALHESAVCWDSVGALQKVLGQLEGETFDHALLCLRAGAARVSPLGPRNTGGMGVVEINDHGEHHHVAAMWAHAIQAAQSTERKVSPAFA